MKALSLGFRYIAYILLLATVAAFGQAPAASTSTPKAGPIPAAILTAKKIFIANDGADGGLFPHPFTGEPNRGYDEFYAEFQRMERYQLVSDPAQADLVLDLRLSAPYGPTNVNKQKGAADPLPTFRLEIYERRSHYVLWALTQTIEPANLQKTHDRNFDEAITNLVADFDALTNRPPTR